MKKSLLLTVLIGLFLVSFTSASWIEAKNGQETTSNLREEWYGTVLDSSKHYGNYEATVHLNQGWNLIATDLEIIPNSGLTLNDLSVIYLFAGASKRYIQLYPQKQQMPNSPEEVELMKTYAKWIYANREGSFRVKGYIYYDAIPLYSGWNLVGFNHFHKGLSVKELTGSCNILKAYEFDNGAWKEWDFDNINNKLDQYDMGKGLAIKVSQNCVLYKKGVGSAPPALPN